MDTPEFSFISMACGYAGCYRAESSTPFEVLLGGDGRPQIFETSMQAIRAAKAHFVPVKVKEGERFQEDILGVEQWLRNKSSQTAESYTIKRAKSFRPFVVERKRKGKRVVQR